MNQSAMFEVSFERNQGLIVKETDGRTYAESGMYLPTGSPERGRARIVCAGLCVH